MGGGTQTVAASIIRQEPAKPTAPISMLPARFATKRNQSPHHQGFSQQMKVRHDALNSAANVKLALGILVNLALSILLGCPWCLADEVANKQVPNKQVANKQITNKQASVNLVQRPVRCIADQRYSDAAGRSGLCDVYLPNKNSDSENLRPAIVIVHGGAWMSGDKWTLASHSRLLARHGFVVVTINYRLAPQHKFPCQVDDVRQALIWTADHAQEYAIDLNRVGMFGYSAGGHLSALVALLADEPMAAQQQASQWEANDPRWKKLPTVNAVCIGGPPCDFTNLPIDNTSMAYFLGGSRRQVPKIYQSASPLTHVSANDPPVQIIHGDADFMVPIANSRKLYRKLKLAGRDVRFRTLARQGHMITFVDPRTKQTMLDFFQQQFIQPTLSPWNMHQLGHAPKMTWINHTAPIRELVYQGQPIDGKPTEVFALYATPGSIAGDASLDKNLPAIVLVHGGGGTAFAPWVSLWAKRGYAAIAMDLAGKRPASPTFTGRDLIVDFRSQRSPLPNGAPDQSTDHKFNSIGGTRDDDWPFHAIANVIGAHSLIRSFDEIDAERTAVTGISWGGYTTCIVASVDDRFKAAVSVYGCGFLYDGESVQRKMIDALSPEKRQQWIEQYDPSTHLPRCHVPILFVNGTNDKHYPLRSYSRSFQLVTGPKAIRVQPNMKHSHQAGWAPKEIGWFVDHYLKEGKPLPKLGKLKRNANVLQADYSSDIPIASATLHFTTDDGPLLKRHWQRTPATFGNTKIQADLLAPPMDRRDATIFFLTVTDQRGAMVSTDMLFNDPATR